MIAGLKHQIQKERKPYADRRFGLESMAGMEKNQRISELIVGFRRKTYCFRYFPPVGNNFPPVRKLSNSPLKAVIYRILFKGGKLSAFFAYKPVPYGRQKTASVYPDVCGRTTRKKIERVASVKLMFTFARI
ncbi:hypothetical protein Barb7_00196 [Bacteroidales bacterium Barb7]|nr:hypothetical protein Barb7_00196 [Bacteroidales bacterium Barb7]